MEQQKRFLILRQNLIALNKINKVNARQYKKEVPIHHFWFFEQVGLAGGNKVEMIGWEAAKTS